MFNFLNPLVRLFKPVINVVQNVFRGIANMVSRVQAGIPQALGSSAPSAPSGPAAPTAQQQEAMRRQRELQRKREQERRRQEAIRRKAELFSRDIDQQSSFSRDEKDLKPVSFQDRVQPEFSAEDWVLELNVPPDAIWAKWGWDEEKPGFVLFNRAQEVMAQAGTDSDTDNPIPVWLQGLMVRQPVEVWAPVYIRWATQQATTSVPELPQDRLQFTQDFYSIYGFGYAPGGKFTKELYGEAGAIYGYGRGQVDFTQWEVDRGVLNPLDDPDPGSAWWRAMNAQVIRDMEEARLIHFAGLDAMGYTGSNEAVNRWLQYINRPSEETWYAAHDTSILLGYEQNEDLAYLETFPERILMVGIRQRLLLAEALVNVDLGPLNGLEQVFENFGAPQGIGVDVIVGVANINPYNYPLQQGDVNNVIAQFLIENFIYGAINPQLQGYADVDFNSVSAYNTGIGLILAGDRYYTLAVGEDNPELRAQYYRLALESYQSAQRYSHYYDTNQIQYIQDQIDLSETELGE